MVTSQGIHVLGFITQGSIQDGGIHGDFMGVSIGDFTRFSTSDGIFITQFAIGSMLRLLT
jgi:hypothetical protein